MGTHYDTLGVPPDATAAELRAAYLARARALHPDHHAGASPDHRARAERAMQAVNAAWAVVGEPQRRRQYDASLERVTPRPTGSPAAAAPPAGAPPPWDDAGTSGDFGPVLPHIVRLAPVLLLLATLGVIFVATAFATGSRSVDISPRSTVSAATPPVGACVRVGPTLRTVSCAEPYDGKVVAIVPARAACPPATVPFLVRDADIVCLSAP